MELFYLTYWLNKEESVPQQVPPAVRGSPSLVLQEINKQATWLKWSDAPSGTSFDVLVWFMQPLAKSVGIILLTGIIIVLLERCVLIEVSNACSLTVHQMVSVSLEKEKQDE